MSALSHTLLNQHSLAASWPEVSSGASPRPLGRVLLVLPAFNEEATLPNLFTRLQKANLGPARSMIAFVVDDGSSDKTAEIARTGAEGLDIRLIQHERNQGLGQAFQTGLAAAAAESTPEDVIVVMDADDTHDIAMVPDMLRALVGGADIAIASRFVAGGDDSTAPPFRRMLSRGASVVFRLALPLDGINDFTSGYRCYRASLIKDALEHWGERLIEEQGFACMVELLLKLRHWHPKIAEIPMVLHYDRKLSTSKLKLGRTLKQYFKLALRDALSPAPRRLAHVAR
jgi:dolichol-phosphate mannosyltransferase